MRTKAYVKMTILFIVITIVLAASAVFADSIFITGTGSPFGTGYDTLGNPHSVGVLNGYFNNPANTVQFVCDDFHVDIWGGILYDVKVSTFNSLTDVRFNDANKLQNYKEAAYLYYQMLNPANNTADIQFALWRIFKGTDPVYGPLLATAGSNAWLTAAQNNYNTLTNAQLSQFRVFTPTNGAQELIGSVVPIPAGVWLLGSGLACLVAMRRRSSLKARKET
jgi:hypothetical protein